MSRLRVLSRALRSIPALSFVILLPSLALTRTARGADDPYLAWATLHFGSTAVSQTAQKATLWGETADPDSDGIANLLEYAADTDPRARTPLSDCYHYSVPESASPSARYPRLTAWLRTDDPDLRVVCQTSPNLGLWWPNAPLDFTQPPPANPYVYEHEIGIARSGLRQVEYIDAQSLAGRPGAFMRLLVARRGQTVTGPGLEPFTFTSQPSTRAGSVVRSNTIVLGGFTGTLSFAIPAGVTLYVNGVAVSGSVAVVKAGDHLWMEAYAPGTVSVPRHFDLTIGSHTARWTVTATAPALVATGSAALPGGSGPESGYTPVETGVSDTGAAQISIPIVVSPGTAGMQPKLAISYSSQGGNGPLGLGFSLSGLSTVSRVGRTIAQDGVKGGVNFDPNDRFAFDGQRLIAISGADGAHNTEYRPEFDPTTRVFSNGIDSGNVSQWTVQTKAGLTLRFGEQIDDANSRIRPEGTMGPLAWGVREIEDSVGNKMLFTYDPVARTRGEMLLSKISYTSNPGQSLAPAQEVIFEYEDRPDPRTSYVAGFAVKMLKRLKAIESRATDGGTMKRVRRYDMTYGQAEINQFSKLLQIVESTTDGTALPATVFSWGSNSSVPFSAVQNTGSIEGIGYDQSPPAHLVNGDFNGDGLTDVLKVDDDGNPWLGLSNGNGTFTHINPVPGLQGRLLSTNSNESRIRTGDFNGDGISDIIHIRSNAVGNLLALGTNTGAFQVSTGGAIGLLTGLGFTPANDGSDIVAIDVNGDGRTDVVRIQTNGDTSVLLAAANNAFVGASPGQLLGKRVAHTTYGTIWIVPGDFNGDGLGDILHLDYLGVDHWLALSNGDGSFTVRDDPPGLAGTTFGFRYSYTVGGDFNGDGLTDVLNQSDALGQNWVVLSKGDGSFVKIAPVSGLQNAVVSNDGPGITKFLTADFNGDGLTDIYHAYPTPSTHGFVAYSKGDGTFSYVGATALGDLNLAFNTDIFSNILPADYDGDGTTDVLQVQQQGNHWCVRSVGFDLNFVTKVINGHGGYTNYSYAPLTNPAVYTKGSGSAYPALAVNGPMVVVREVETKNGLEIDPFSGQNTGASPGNAVSYRYEAGWASTDGRGFHGFKAVETTDVTSGIVSRTEYESSSPLLGGRPKHSEQRLLPANVPPGGSALISSSDMTWDVHLFQRAGYRNTYQITEGTSISLSYEVNRPAATALVKTVSRGGPGTGGIVTYDDYGNLLQSTTTTTAGGETFTETVTNTYNDQTGAKWFIGRLATSSVTKTAPGTPALTRSSSFAYHATTGLLTQEVIEPGGGALRQQKDYLHDSFGNIATSTISTAGEASRTTTTFYTPDGRFVSETRNAKAHAETKTYDPLLGNVLTQTGPNGLTTSWEYDSLGRPIREVRPDGTETRSFYRRVTASTAGAPPRAVHFVRVQSSGGAPRTVWYDLLDREIRTDAVSFDGRTVSAHKVYNPRGEVTDASQPYFAGDTPLYSQMLYDAVGRETRQTDPGPRVTITAYDGLTTSVTNPKNQTVSTTANAMGWTVQTTDAAGKSINRSYDAYGNLKTVTDPAGNTTTLGYDVRGNKTSMSEPNSGASSFTYNGFGELKTQTNAAGQQVSLSYDVLGRVVSRTEPEGTTTFTYDNAARGIGQLASEQSGEFARVFFYDALSRAAATVETHGFHRFAVSRSYDVVGRPDALTFPTGLGVRQTYTALGHLAMVQNAANPAQFHWAALQVNARGQVTQEVLGNGVVTDRAFDPQTGLVDGITTSFNAAGDIQKLEFDFDLIGNLTERRDVRYTTPFIETFGYDTLNRLKTVATTGSAGVTADYNDLGNLTRRSDVGDFSYGSGRPHAVTAVTGSSGGTFNKTCAYDAKGNRIADGQSTLDYSSFNKPTRIRKGDDTLRFDYGPDRALYRQTLFRTDAGIEKQTVREYIGGLYERETTNEGVVRHIHYIAGGSGVVAIHTDERSAATDAQRTRYIHKDHLGSVDVITDSAGGFVERQSFDAWGRRREVAYTGSAWQVSYPAAPAPGAASETHRGFTGHEMLDAVGLVHMGGRVYDPLTARFLSPDPFVQSPDNLQNLNRYSYVLNNPLSFTDPSGFFFKSIGKFLKKHWRTVVAVGVGILSAGTAVWASALIAGQAVSFGTALGAVVGTGTATLTGFGAAVAGAGLGFGSAFSGTLLAGGSVGDALRAGLTSGALGAVQGRLAFGIGGKFGHQTTWDNVVQKTIAHGVSGGAVSAIGGGNFKHGFLSGAVSPGASFISAGLPGAARLAIATLAGGTAAELGGGKFANGAVTAASIHLFNEMGLNERRLMAEPDNTEEFLRLGMDLSNESCPATLGEFQNAFGNGAVLRDDPFTNSYTPTCESMWGCGDLQIWATNTSSGIECAYNARSGLYVKDIATWNIANPVGPGVEYRVKFFGYDVGKVTKPTWLEHRQLDTSRKKDWRR